jgi:hypothetical protein
MLQPCYWSRTKSFYAAPQRQPRRTVGAMAVDCADAPLHQLRRSAVDRRQGCLRQARHLGGIMYWEQSLDPGDELLEAAWQGLQ